MPGSRSEALELIAGWDTARVVALLRKNGAEEACWKAAEKRQIDGDELLHLTEGKLALWKSDLTRPLIWSLWTFVEELKKCPENYVEDKPAQQEPEQPQQQSEEQQQVDADALSDTGSWDTDFEDNVDDVAEETVSAVEMRPGNAAARLNSDFRNSLRMFQENDRLQMEAERRGSSYSISRVSDRNGDAPISESTYANCEINTTPEPDINTYANIGFAEDAPTPPPEANYPPKNPSRLHSSMSNHSNASSNNSIGSCNNNSEPQKSLAEKLKEQLALMGTPPMVKPAVTPKSEALLKKSKEEVILRRSEPRTSFLHKAVRARVNGTSGVPKKMSVPPPAEPKEKPQREQSCTEDALKNLPKPPVTIRSFDLVANLPIMRPPEESEDDDEESYEAFDEQIVEQHQRNSMLRAESGQSLSSARQNSVESVYQPPSSISHDEEEVYEIYESITESPEENGHNYSNETVTKTPPPLPAKPPPNIMQHNHQNQNLHKSESERSLEKKSATLPHSGSNTSLTNAARPLPPPPDRKSYYERPWFHNLTREEANHLIEEQCTYGNSPDGYFLMRPSTTNPNNPLTLVLWCKDRVYNVPVRRRPDNRYALGSSKLDEQSFASIDDIIPFYKKEKLVLYTSGAQSGSTRLTDTPPK